MWRFSLLVGPIDKLGLQLSKFWKLENNCQKSEGILLTLSAEINTVFKGLHNSILSEDFTFIFKILHNLRKRDRKFATWFNTFCQQLKHTLLKIQKIRSLLIKVCINKYFDLEYSSFYSQLSWRSRVYPIFHGVKDKRVKQKLRCNMEIPLFIWTPLLNI